jgi:small neutral amino acid transporter SnatA (MarC family)
VSGLTSPLLAAAAEGSSVEFNAADVFVVLLIGLGPIKAAMVYLGVTSGLPREVRVRVARRAISVAGIVALALFLLGAALAALLHISTESLAVAGGLVLLLLGLRMILGQGTAPTEGGRPPDPEAIAIFPLALPLLLNPIGIVALFTYSGTTDFGEALVTLGLIAAVLVVDAVVFLGLSKVGPLNPQVVSVVEIVLGFLLAALAVELIVSALNDAGIITLSTG